MTTGLTKALAEFVAKPTFGGQEQAAYTIAKTGFIDTIATMMAGHREPVVDVVRQFFAQATTPAEAPVPFLGTMHPAAQAAFINAVAGHALDYDDVAISGHPSTVLVPAILAEGYKLNSSGLDAVRAYIVGYEVWAELLSREPEQYHLKGWHPTGVFGAVGAAAAVAYLNKLSVDEARQALAISASLASGLVANFGTMTKPFHAGRAASHGIDAVRLSKLGMTSATDVFEHPAGYLFALSLSGRADLKRPADTLGKTLRILDSGLSIKRYPVCYSSHRTIDGVLAIVERENLKAEDISKVHVTMGHAQASMLRNKHPVTGLEAKFSAQFAVASAVVARQVGLSQLTDAFATRPDVSELYGKVSVTTVNTVCPFEPAFALTDRVVIETTGGKKFDSGEIRFPLGNAKNPIDAAGLKAKFMDCVATGKAENPAMHGADAGLYDRIAGLENLPSVQSLFGK
jgi:2-methylcitrate dehydratase PrpD